MTKCPKCGHCEVCGHGGWQFYSTTTTGGVAQPSGNIVWGSNEATVAFPRVTSMPAAAGAGTWTIGPGHLKHGGACTCA